MPAPEGGEPVRWTSPDDIIDGGQIESLDFSDAMYYLFDTETESIYGLNETVQSLKVFYEKIS